MPNNGADARNLHNLFLACRAQLIDVAEGIGDNLRRFLAHVADIEAE